MSDILVQCKSSVHLSKNLMDALMVIYLHEGGDRYISENNRGNALQELRDKLGLTSRSHRDMCIEITQRMDLVYMISRESRIQLHATTSSTGIGHFTHRTSNALQVKINHKRIRGFPCFDKKSILPTLNRSIFGAIMPQFMFDRWMLTHAGVNLIHMDDEKRLNLLLSSGFLSIEIKDRQPRNGVLT